MIEANKTTLQSGGEPGFDGTPAAFKDRCSTFLTVLCNDKDLAKASGYLAPNCVILHEDLPPVRGAEAFIAFWHKNLGAMPGYHKDIKDTMVEINPADGGVARVWVYSRISGLKDGDVRDSIDMMRFTSDGLFLESKDVQRAIKQS